MSFLARTMFTLLLLHLVACDNGGNNNSPAITPPADRQSTLAYPDSPTQVKLVSVTSTDVGTIITDWLPAEDSQTTHSSMKYTVHISEIAGFIPDASTAVATVTGAITTIVSGLKKATRYYVAVVAEDESGNESWSNQLDLITVSTTLKRTNAVVHAQEGSIVQEITNTSVTFDAVNGIPAVGEIIVSAKNGGYLRKITQITMNGEEVTAQTTPASLNELFDELEFSTSVKFGDYADQNRSAQSSIVLKSRKNVSGANELHWPSGLTMIDNNPPIQSRTSQTIVVKKGTQNKVKLSDDNLTQISFWGGNSVETSKAFIKGPSSKYVQPNDTLNFTLKASVVPNKTDSEICAIHFLGLEHKDNSKDNLPNSAGGDFTWIHPQDDKVSANYAFSWKPVNAHVHEGALPYRAQFKVYIDQKGDNCSGADLFALWEAKLDITVPIYVGMGQDPNLKDQKKTIEFTGDVNVTDIVTVNFEPAFDISAKISGASLSSAKIAVKSNLSLINDLTINATGSGIIHPTEKDLFQSKKFIRVFTAGPVPIVVAGEFGVRIKIEGNVTGAMSLNKTIELALTKTEFGLKYNKENGGWESIGDRGTPSYKFELKGEGEAAAHIKLTLIPDFQLHFYDTASGRILLEPYIYGDAAIQGHFIYKNTNDLAGSDADYWFDELVAGAGMDLRLYAGLHVFDYNIFSYPSNVTVNQTDKFALFSPINKTPIWGIPELVATSSTPVDADDSRSILITGTTTDVPFPFGSDSLNPFQMWTEPKVIENELLITDGRVLLESLAEPGEYHLIYTEPGDFTIRLFGHSEAGAFLRQKTRVISSSKENPLDINIILTDEDSDGMVDQWEERYGLNILINDAESDLDEDGLSNLDEFNRGSYPNNSGDSNLLKATAGDTSIDFIWNPVEGAIQYTLYISTEKGITPENYSTLQNGQSINILQGQLSYLMTGLENGTTYHAILAAVDADATNSLTPEVSATPQFPCDPLVENCDDPNQPEPPACEDQNCQDDQGNRFSSATAMGDPHIRTFDGLSYDFHGVGEYILVKSDSGDLEIQTRTQPWGSRRNVSLNAAVAAKINDDRVGFYRAETGLAVLVNGTLNELVEGYNDLPAGGSIYRYGHIYTLIWPDQSQINISRRSSFIEVKITLDNSRQGTISGILGYFDGSLQSELRASDGQTFDSNALGFTNLYDVFGESWRVDEATTLFDYFDEETPEGFVDRDFPSNLLTPETIHQRIGDEEYQRITALCQQFVTLPGRLDACIIDVAITGIEEGLEAYRRIAKPNAVADIKAPPSVSITTPVTGSIQSSNVTIRGTIATDININSIELSINGGNKTDISAYLTDQGFIFSLPTNNLIEGNNQVVVYANDANSNTGNAVVFFVYDSSVAPEAGGDVIVINDVNAFDNIRINSNGADNIQFVKNLVNFTGNTLRATGNRVLWYRYASRCSDTCISSSIFRDTFVNEGFIVDEVISDDGLINIAPEVKLLILWTPTVALNSAEIGSLKAFASEGGRILFVGENKDFYLQTGIDVENQFLIDMGALMRNIGQAVLGGDTLLQVSSGNSHQTMTNVSQIQINYVSLIELGPNDYPLLTSADGSKVVAAVARININLPRVSLQRAARSMSNQKNRPSPIIYQNPSKNQ